MVGNGRSTRERRLGCEIICKDWDKGKVNARKDIESAVDEGKELTGLGHQELEDFEEIKEMVKVNPIGRGIKVVRLA